MKYNRKDLDEKEGKLIGGLWQWMEKRSTFTTDDVFNDNEVYIWIILIYGVRVKKGICKINEKQFKQYAKSMLRGKPLPDEIRFDVEDELRSITTELTEEYKKVAKELKEEEKHE
jgi:hypothetical protein